MRSFRRLSPLRVSLSLGLALTLLTVAACDDGNGPIVIRDEGTVILEITHQVDGEALVFDDLSYTSDAGHDFSVSKLEYYICEVSFHTAGGGSWSIPLEDNFHYQNAREPETTSWSFDGVPNGDYTSVSLVFGLSEELNVAGGLGPELPHSNMTWPVGELSGYHYMRLEGKYDDGAPSYLCHTGRLVMGGLVRSGPVPITLDDADFTVAGDSKSIELVMNINEWFRNPNEYDFMDYPGMIMMNAAAQKALEENGASIFSVGSIE